MGEVHPFPSVPNSFGLCDQALVLDGYSELWSPDSQASIDEAFANIGLNEMGKQPFHLDPVMESCLSSSENCSLLDVPRAWQLGSQDWHPKDCLPYELKVPSNATARGAWTPIDQEASCSGGGSWSSYTSDSRSEVGGMYGRQQSPWGSHRSSITQIPFGGSSDFHGDGYHCAPAKATVISPQALQHHQDQDDLVDAPSPRVELQGIGASHEYYSDHAEIYSHAEGPDHYYQKVEEPCIFMHIMKPESPTHSLKEEEDMDEDAGHDDDEEWSPKSEKYGHRRQLSRRTTMTRNPPSAPKRPQRTRPATIQTHHPTKVVKRQPKPLISSNTANRNGNLLPCPQCHDAFPSESTLKKHVLASHTRPFVCTFHNYGCDSTVGSKNEWKRHINVQHMHLETWRCDIGTCATSTGVPDDYQSNGTHMRGPSQQVPSIAGNLDNAASQPHDFDRKDLFTQHMKRMHAPNPSASRSEKQAFEASIEAAQQRCYRKLRDPPVNTICPFCPDHPAFDSWDDRIEHVGKHLEKDEVNHESEVEDINLMRWLQEAGYVQWKSSGWKLSDNGKKKKRTVVKKEAEDEDAEGEEDDDDGSGA